MNIPDTGEEITAEFIEFATMEMKEAALLQTVKSNEKRIEKLQLSGIGLSEMFMMQMRLGLLAEALMSREQMLDLDLRFQQVLSNKVISVAESNMIKQMLLQGINGQGVPPKLT